jgi:pyridoxal/pyridoxine/pyridoxamine kinase
MSDKSKRIPRVLSIQSHVVHGFVGNKCAAFILQVFLLLKSKIWLT